MGDEGIEAEPCCPNLPLFVYHNTFVTDIPNVDAIAPLEPGQVTFIPPRGDFTPRAGSPLIDRGIVISGINERLAGRGPDIGAIESRH